MTTPKVTEVFKDPVSTAAEGSQGGRESQATTIVRLARDSGAEFFHDDETAYAHVRVGSHYETYPLRSKRGRAWLLNLFIDEENKAPGSQAVADAVNSLEALALRGDEHRVHVRIARVENRVYLDLADTNHTIVEVTPTGWRTVHAVQVRFRRPRGLLPIQRPSSMVTAADVGLLRPFVNVTDEGFVLLVSLLVTMLRGRGPYPTLGIMGEQGTAKSTLCRVVKELIDPNVAPLRSEPREPRDLMIAANNNHVLVFDNLSHISPALSDCFCRLATGGGFSTRMLYENAEEQIFDAVRPVVLNGIAEVATRPDLVSRMVTLTAPTISETARRDEGAFWADFARVQPQILGALLEIVTVALERENAVTLETKPRMADFAVWIAAAEPACPWPAGRFLELYAGNRQEAIDATLDGDPLADAVKAIAPWTGTASDLLDEINKRTTDEARRRPGWFRKPRQVSDALRRLAPALRHVGIDVAFDREAHSRRRLIHLTRLERPGVSTSPASPAVHTRKTAGFKGDGSHEDLPNPTPPSPPESPLNARNIGAKTEETDGDASERNCSSLVPHAPGHMVSRHECLRESREDSDDAAVF